MRYVIILALLVACNQPSATPPHKVDAKPRNYALDFVTSEDPDAKCVVYHQHEGPKLLDSVKCTLSDKRRVFVRIDTDATKVDRLDPDQAAPAPAPSPVKPPPPKK